MRSGLACAALLALAGCNDVVSCETVTADVGLVCLPDAFAPDVSSVIEARELCGKGCSGNPACTALFTGGRVVLDVTQDLCTDAQSAACIDQGCLTRLMRCELPALPAGDYTIAVPGGPSQLIHVRAGGQSSCRFAETDGGVQ
jgi:hypothetical protein